MRIDKHDEKETAYEIDNPLGHNTEAIIKWNGGIGALLCNGCNIVIALGFDHDRTKAHYCSECTSR